MECFFKLIGLVSSLSALVLEIVNEISQCWRLWQFNNKVVQFVSFGLFEVCYPQEFNISGTVAKMLLYTPINSTWTISPEFKYAQTLLLWAILMEPVVMIFDSIAVKITCMKDPFLELQIYCYKISALVLCVSSIFTCVSVSWNHFVDHYGQTSLYFPPYFPVKKEALIDKYYTSVFPVGLLTVSMSLIGVILINALKLQSQTKAQRVCIVANQVA